MNARYEDTFRGLPLTPEQQREVLHYIMVRERAGQPWDTPELKIMLGEMLDPPEPVEEDGGALERAMAAESDVAHNEESDQTDLLKCERDHNH